MFITQLHNENLEYPVTMADGQAESFFLIFPVKVILSG